MDKFFKLKERGTSVKVELIAGMTTFFAMVYILMVNANMFADPFGDGSNPLGVSYGAIYIATAISAVVGTILAFKKNIKCIFIKCIYRTPELGIYLHNIVAFR